MATDNKEIQVEETIEKVVESTQPIVEEKIVEKTTEKTFTQIEVNAMLKKQKDAERKKTQTVEERLEAIEKEREEERLKTKIAKNEEIDAKKSLVTSIISERVKETYVSDVTAIIEREVNFETMTNDEITAKVNEVTGRLPGIEKGSNITSTQLQTAEVRNKQENVTEKKDAEGEDIYINQFGTKTATQKQYDELNAMQKNQFKLK